MQWGQLFSSVVFFPQTHNPSLIPWKHQKIQTGRHATKCLTSILFGSVTVRKDEERLRNRRQLEKTGSPSTGSLIVMLCPGFNTGTERRHFWKNWWNPSNSCSLVISIVLMLDKATMVMWNMNTRKLGEVCMRILCTPFQFFNKPKINSKWMVKSMYIQTTNKVMETV